MGTQGLLTVLEKMNNMQCTEYEFFNEKDWKMIKDGPLFSPTEPADEKPNQA